MPATPSFFCCLRDTAGTVLNSGVRNLEVEEVLCIGFYFLFDIGSVLVVRKGMEWVRIDYSDKALESSLREWERKLNKDSKKKYR